MVSVTASPTKIEVSSSATSVGVTLSSTPITASASGGPGPTGPPGPPGSQSLDGLVDVALNNPQTGDLLRYSSGAWANYGEKQLTDGGNF